VNARPQFEASLPARHWGLKLPILERFSTISWSNRE